VAEEVIPDDDTATDELEAGREEMLPTVGMTEEADREVVLPTVGMAEDEAETVRLAVLDDETAEVGVGALGTDAARRVALYTESVFALPQISPDKPLQLEAQ
jgi:hypothetical protein